MHKTISSCFRYSTSALPWFTALIGLTALGWGCWRDRGGPLAWSGGGTTAGVAVVMASDRLLRRLTPRAERPARKTEPAQKSVKRLPQPSAVAPETKGRDASSVLRPGADDPTRHSRSLADANIRALVNVMLAEGRYALLLRPQVAGNLNHALQTKAQAELDREMSLIPAGEVLLEPIALGDPDESAEPDDVLIEPGTVIQVATAYLDRYPVTNAQFQTFVDAGGYEQPAIWDPAIWPAVLGFVDSTNQPGPRHWRNGRFSPGKENHPVVGVCWYEAVAYARWVGKRLPADAEWVKAACWPVQLTAASRVQRKYPWGNSLERGRANLWSTGLGDTVAVSQMAAGGSVGGVYHLIGNIWEWIAEDFELPAAAPPERADRPLRKVLRGGAFDTYFEQQATCQFASGESPLARRANIGFRCAWESAIW